VATAASVRASTLPATSSVPVPITGNRAGVNQRVECRLADGGEHFFQFRTGGTEVTGGKRIEGHSVTRRHG
jgi:hypothetical protein